MKEAIEISSRDSCLHPWYAKWPKYLTYKTENPSPNFFEMEAQKSLLFPVFYEESHKISSQNGSQPESLTLIHFANKIRILLGISSKKWILIISAIIDRIRKEISEESLLRLLQKNTSLLSCSWTQALKTIYKIMRYAAQKTFEALQPYKEKEEDTHIGVMASYFERLCSNVAFHNNYEKSNYWPQIQSLYIDWARMQDISATLPLTLSSWIVIELSSSYVSWVNPLIENKNLGVFLSFIILYHLKIESLSEKFFPQLLRFSFPINEEIIFLALERFSYDDTALLVILFH